MPKNNLKLADDFAVTYDNCIVKNNWSGPGVIFNLAKDLLKSNSKILDLGIGTGESAVRFKKAGHKIIGLDGSAKMLEQCKKKKIGSELILHNLEKFPYPVQKNCFDVVISNAVFHLIHPIKTVFSEVKSALKQQGFFVFTFENTDDVSDYTEIESSVWKMKTTTGVFTYKHSTHYISELLKQNDFQIEKQKQFLAYTNSELQKDFYFTVIVAQFQPV